MKLLHLFLALFTATLFLACSSDKEQLQVETNLTTYSEDVVELQASGAKAYSWRQISGTPVILINANSATPSFIAPNVSTEETLVFELEAVTVQLENKNITVKKEVNVRVFPKLVETDTNTTQTSATLKSLKLTLEKNSLNVDENTTLKVVANYEDNTTKDVTDEVEWNLSDATAAQITQKSLHAKKDTNIFIQAKLGTISSNTLALEIYKEINGHRLPPEPNPTINNATLLGVDSNNNGVRDDVERWIYETYEEPVERGLFIQMGYAYQKIIIDPKKAKETQKYMHDQLSCEFYWTYDAKDANETFQLDGYRDTESEIKPIQMNTLTRHMAYEHYNAEFHGTVLDQVPHDKNMCLFDENGHLKVQP